MFAATGPRPATERLRAEARFRLALVVSLAAHLALAAIWRSPLPDNRPAGHAALSVEFRTPAPAAAPAPAVEPSGNPATSRPRLLTSPLPSQTLTEDEGRQNPDAARRPAPFIAVAPPSRTAEGSQASELAPGGDTIRRGERPGEVAVILVINDDGYVGRIHWDRLPSMSAEQFRRLENRLRDRAYPGRGGQAITETIDVLALLRTDAQDAQLASAPPAAPVQSGVTGSPGKPGMTGPPGKPGVSAAPQAQTPEAAVRR